MHTLVAWTWAALPERTHRILHNGEAEAAAHDAELAMRQLAKDALATIRRLTWITRNLKPFVAPDARADAWAKVGSTVKKVYAADNTHVVLEHGERFAQGQMAVGHFRFILETACHALQKRARAT